jgi:uncharacterized protein (DUF1501 family)
MNTRRIFIRNSALAMVGAGTAPLWLERALAASTERGKILVAIFQRGAADGLNIVVPHADSAYYELRPSIAVPRPGTAGEQAALDLDGYFGLHPALASLKPLWDDRSLAIVHAAGSPDPTRSHFEAQDYMESGAPGVNTAEGGWMNRALVPAGGRTARLRAVSLGAALPRTLAGPAPAVAMDGLRGFGVRNPEAARRFERLYGESADPLLGAAGRDAFQAAAEVERIAAVPYKPAGGAVYPAGRFGDSLRQIAQLIKAGAGVEMAFADIGGWDHHVNEPAPLAALLRQFGDSLAAFSRDMGDRMADIALVTMSEFGRTARENGDRGTDHGHANCMFVLGGAVRGGKVYGRWPGLASESLYEGRDLALTTDFRDVLGELVVRHTGNADLARVFPGYQPKFRGLV